MKLIIDIPEEDYNFVKRQVADGITNPLKICIANGTPLDEKELKLKRWIEKDIETLNFIIESGWLISDCDKCTAIDACEDAITALKQYPVLDKVRAELEQIINGYEEMGELPYEISPVYGLHYAIQIIDKYRAESEDLGDYPDTIPNQFDNMTGSMNL